MILLRLCSFVFNCAWILAWMMVMLSLPRKQHVLSSKPLQDMAQDINIIWVYVADWPAAVKDSDQHTDFCSPIPLPWPFGCSALPGRVGSYCCSLFKSSLKDGSQMRFCLCHWSCSEVLPCSWAGLLFEMCLSSTDCLGFRDLLWNSEVTWSWLTYVVSDEIIKEIKSQRITKPIYLFS